MADKEPASSAMPPRINKARNKSLSYDVQAISEIICVFFLQADLVNTIGESAAMGTAGVVIWEKDETKTEVNSFKFVLVHSEVHVPFNQLRHPSVYLLHLAYQFISTTRGDFLNFVSGFQGFFWNA